MKKLYVSADIEGVCGIADWKETEIAEAQGAYFREQMTREVQAVCEAACEAGVGEIFVKDAHGSGRNINPMMLSENVRLMRAWTRDPFSMMAGIDSSFDGAAFVGYHSGAGSDGNPLAHTMDTANVWVLVNGGFASEFLINAYTAAFFGVPVLFLSGDRLLCESAAKLDPGIGTVAVSEGLGNASISLQPALAVARIREKAAAAFAATAKKDSRCLKLPDEFRMEIRFRQHHLAYRGSFYPGAVQTGPYEVAYAAGSWLDVLKFLFFVL
ncbi:MAG: M55 family metallopeptidase [Spirochaetes bacterium]|nr:M55 family metallopeptidase [Spirochaetota bacterium]